MRTKRAVSEDVVIKWKTIEQNTHIIEEDGNGKKKFNEKSHIKLRPHRQVI